MRSPLRLLPLVLCLLLPVLVGVRSAGADEWSDAKKAFRKAQKAPDLKTRRDAFIDMLTFDGTEQTEDAVEEILRTLGREESPAVILTALETLSTFTSDEATEILVDAVRKGRGTRRFYALIALADRPAGGGEDLLMEVLDGKEEPLIAQAALALGHRQTEAAVPLLLPLLAHDTWQLRAAAARALEYMAGKAVLNPKTAEMEFPPVPAWLKTPEVLNALVASLETAEGRSRSDAVSALERITGRAFSNDVRAWKALLGGADPAGIRARPEAVPYIFGIPIYGRKVVLVIDISTCTDDTHPF